VAEKHECRPLNIGKIIIFIAYIKDMELPPEKKAKAQSLYENGMSTPKIAEKLSINPNTAKAWAKKGEWSKGRIIPELVQKETETLLKLAEKKGLTQGKVIDKIQELLEAQRLVSYVEIDGRREAILRPDYKTQAKAINQAITIKT